MKQINDMGLEEKLNLMLYQYYKVSLLESHYRLIIFGFISVMAGILCFFIPDIIKTYVEIDIMIGVTFISIMMLALLIFLFGFLLIGIGLIKTSKDKKRLQLAFNMKNEGRFNDVFDIKDKDIKKVKRIWNIEEVKK